MRVTAENLNRLLGLAGESLVESRWLKPFAESLLRLKRLQHEAGTRARRPARGAAGGQRRMSPRSSRSPMCSGGCSNVSSCCRERLAELEMFERRSTGLAHRLYDEALACRMRPFADGVQGFPRMVRDLARALGKQVRLEIVG